jgi:hypothetical protein
VRWSLVASTLLVTLAIAAPAHAGEARLWACHGPAGEALGDVMQRFAAYDAELVGTCGGRFTRADPGGGSAAGVVIDAPPGVTLTGVRLDRRAQGPGFRVATASETLERVDDASVRDGVTTLAATTPSSGDQVRAGLACDVPPSLRCPDYGAGAFELRSVALLVRDDAAPTIAIGGLRNPAQGELVLDIRVADAGLGLATVAATLDGKSVGGATFGACAELSPADATIDRALGADCPGVSQATARVDTTQVLDGEHELLVTVTDAAGNRTTPPVWAFDVLNHVDPGSSTGTIEIGNGTPTPTPTPTPTASPSPQPATPVVTVTTQSVTPAATRKPTTRELVKLPSKLKVAKNGTVRVSVLCPAVSAQACDLRLKLTQGRTTIASGRGRAKPGTRATVKLKLSKAARRTLARRHKLDATLTLAGSAPATVHLRQ